MNKGIRAIIITLAAGIAGLNAAALDLPVKTVDGRQYYYYHVEGRQSVHGISKRLGLSKEQIVSCNPSVADGVRPGMTLYFPVEDFAEVESPATTPTEESAAPEPAQTTPGVHDADESNPILNVQDPADVEEGELMEENATETESRRAPALTVALPFNLDGDRDARSSRYALDFYKGFLLAADTLAERSGKLDIIALDYSGDAALPDSVLRAPNVVIAPESESLDSLARRCAEHGTYLLNLFAVRDTSYMTNPYMMQANIPAEIMYAKATSGLLSEYEGYVPVIIRNKQGRNEKEPFTQYLAAYLESNGMPYLQIEYDGSLVSAELAPLEADQSVDYVIVPSSGTLAEFNRFAHVIKNYRDGRVATALSAETTDENGNAPQEASHQKIGVFGYPDWIAFRSEAEDMLHSLEATIYSRFYDDYDSFSNRTLSSEFMRWYGAPMIESVPSQGLLGFDAGNYLIRNIRACRGEFRPEFTQEYRGVQSTFKFERVPGGGYVNTALYIIKYLPAGMMSSRVL